MAWTSGVTRSSLDLISPDNWNDSMGAGGNHDHLFNGTRFNSSLTFAISLNAGSRANKQGLVADSTVSGGFRWSRDEEEGISMAFLLS